MVEGCNSEGNFEYIDKTVKATITQFQTSSIYTEANKYEVDLEFFDGDVSWNPFADAVTDVSKEYYTLCIPETD
jgi:hypothetical protein